MKTNKTWRLPPPEKLSSGLQWFPVVRVGRVVPFGYEQDPNDEDILLPLTEELETLELAKKHLKQYSYRDMVKRTNWQINLSRRVNEKSKT